MFILAYGNVHIICASLMQNVDLVWRSYISATINIKLSFLELRARTRNTMSIKLIQSSCGKVRDIKDEVRAGQKAAYCLQESFG